MLVVLLVACNAVVLFEDLVCFTVDAVEVGVVVGVVVVGGDGGNDVDDVVDKDDTGAIGIDVN